LKKIAFPKKNSRSPHSNTTHSHTLCLALYNSLALVSKYPKKELFCLKNPGSCKN